MKVEPRKAAVRPRIIRSESSGESSPLVEEITSLLESGKSGIVAIHGGPGAGKTTALEHLSAVFANEPRLVLHDLTDESLFATGSGAESLEIVHRLTDDIRQRSETPLVVYAARIHLRLKHLTILRVAPWQDDEVIEYLLATHKDQCASVMGRLKDPADKRLAGANPEVWRVALDELAADGQVQGVAQALLRHFENRLVGKQLQELASSYCLEKMTRPFSSGPASTPESLNQVTTHGVPEQPPQQIALIDLPGETVHLSSPDPERKREDLTGILTKHLKVHHLGRIVAGLWEGFLVDLDLERKGIPRDILRLLRHRGPQLLLSSSAIVGELQSGGESAFLEKHLPPDLLKRAAQALAANEPARTHLKQMISRSEQKKHPMAASLLYLSDKDWRPETGANLVGAFLEGARWPEINLSLANLSRANLLRADLSRANLDSVHLGHSDLRFAKLSASSMRAVVARDAQMEGADLSEVEAEGGQFNESMLQDASFRKARLKSSSFDNATLIDADFTEADIRFARFEGAKLAGTRFSKANLEHAWLAGLDLRQTDLAGARLSGANLEHSNLESMELPGMDFSSASLRGANLTGSFMPGANFQDADLQEAGLGEIEWERANLRGADLRRSTFHMGSSRSGLVFSPIASEGTRTGFYTDDTQDQAFKSPEEIRKANLCGADLRGAKIEGVDFYLVDLRGARFDSDQEEWLRKSGAILESRTLH